MSCFVILGMHRSGTSCLTGTLQECGIELGNVHVKNPFNLRGNREHPAVMALNDELLEQNGGAWDAPIVVTRWNDQQAEQRESILDEVKPASGSHWGFKDPRTLFTLPFWQESLPPDTIYIATFRHPLAVARSLAHRNKFPIDKGLSIWKAYNSRLLVLAKDIRVPMLNFDLPADRYRSDLLDTLASIGIAGKGGSPGFFDPRLRNQGADLKPSDIHDPEALSIYNDLLLHARHG